MDNNTNKMGFWGFPVGKFLPYMERMTNLSKHQLKTKIPIMHDVYSEGIRKGLKPFDNTHKTDEILYYIMDKTYYPYDEILSFLIILSEFAKSGEIDIKYYLVPEKKNDMWNKFATMSKITGAGSLVLLAGASAFAIGYFLKQLK